MAAPRSALGLLLRLKLRAHLRSLRQRASTPSGLLFGLLGLVVVGLWFSALVLRPGSQDLNVLADGELEPFVRSVLMMLAGFSVLGALSHRGLYLPGAEIERLFSAPISRSDLVRFRLVTNVGRSLTFAIITSLVFARRLPEQAFAIPGLMLTMISLPVLGQGAALLFGDAENRLGRLAARLPAGPIRFLIALFFWMLVMGMFLGEDFAHLISDWLPDGLDPFRRRAPWDQSGPNRFLQQGWLQTLTSPAAPWSRMICAQGLRPFLSAFALCLGLWGLLFEAVARLPIDFRELSLETSANVAKRLARIRSGRSLISGGEVSRRTLGWSVPWLFGRGPFGAVAWLKTCAIVRKSRGTLLFYAFVMAVLTLVSFAIGQDGPEGVERGGVMVAVLGTIYLGMGLRFDFRSDLDSMESIKSWPLSNSRLFLATILPEVLLISLLVALAVLMRSLLIGAFPLALIAWLLMVPVVALLWTALDNAVFLWAPVRYTPGQGGSMQYAGRSLLLVLLRLLLLGLVALGTFGCVMALRWLMLRFGVELKSALVVGAVGGVLVVLLSVATLIALGGRALARFDVTDRL